MAFTSQSGKLLTLALTACLAQSAHATLIQLTGLNNLSSTDAVLTFPDADGSMYSNSVAYNATGNTLTFSGDSMIRSVVGTDYFYSAFANGTPILTAGGYSGFSPLNLSFANPVSEVGFNLESPVYYGNYNVSFTAYDGAQSLGTVTASGSVPNSLAFLGAQVSAGDQITRLVLNTTPGYSLSLGPIHFGNLGSGTSGGPGSGSAAVPEPSTLALFGLGLIALVGLKRSRSRA